MSNIEVGLLSIRQMASKLGVSVRTVQYWHKAGRLPGFTRLYGHRRWRSDIVEKWIKDKCPSLLGVQIGADEDSAIDDDDDDCEN